MKPSNHFDRIRLFKLIIALLFAALGSYAQGAAAYTESAALRRPVMNRLVVSQLGLLINDSDPYSVAVGTYYQTRRGIPAANVVHVSLPYVPSTPGGPNPWDQQTYNTARDLSQSEFDKLKAQVDSQLPPQVQAIAVAWMNPSRVVWNADYGQPLHINSITSALARGLSTGGYYPNTGRSSCEVDGTPSPYYNTISSRPYDDFGLRPAMLLAAYSVAQAQALIDRGIASDGTFPYGKADILYTSDFKRRVRSQAFPSAGLGNALSGYVFAEIDGTPAAPIDYLTGTASTLFYAAGTPRMTALATNTFIPGSTGEALTSTGGVLPDGAGQMPILEWIAAGETGTFGTVAEPCDFDGPFPFIHKFPDPAILIPRYTAGETLIEAYWKSMPQTFQGLFVGEPLAHPWSR